MRESHGIPDAAKVSATSTDTQAVTVTDGTGWVHLSLGSCIYPAALTPRQAYFIAEQLKRSADRVTAQKKK